MVGTRFLGAATAIVLIDQATKWMFQGSSYASTNTGAGFGILQGQTGFLAVISALVVIGVLLYYPKIEKGPSQVLFGLFLGGVIGNGIDRIFRGFVIDFINVGWWPSFNVADAAITIAVFGLIFVEWKK